MKVKCSGICGFDQVEAILHALHLDGLAEVEADESSNAQEVLEILGLLPSPRGEIKFLQV